MVKKQQSGCWEWQGALRRGYGKFALKGGRKAYAHRVAFYLATGIEPVGKLVTHDCDNPLCVNPDHLRLGDEYSNFAESVLRGRKFIDIHRTKRNGGGGGKRRLPQAREDRANEIRRLYMEGWGGYKRLAKRFGVGRSTVQDIVLGRTWNRPHTPTEE